MNPLLNLCIFVKKKKRSNFLSDLLPENCSFDIIGCYEYRNGTQVTFMRGETEEGCDLFFSAICT